MNWISIEDKYPDADEILCCSGNQVFICKFFETKWGNSYKSTDWNHQEVKNTPEWTHWMPLPEPSKGN